MVNQESNNSVTQSSSLHFFVGLSFTQLMHSLRTVYNLFSFARQACSCSLPFPPAVLCLLGTFTHAMNDKISHRNSPSYYKKHSNLRVHLLPFTLPSQPLLCLTPAQNDGHATNCPCSAPKSTPHRRC